MYEDRSTGGAALTAATPTIHGHGVQVFGNKPFSRCHNEDAHWEKERGGGGGGG